jgi:hypothetical protein
VGSALGVTSFSWRNAAASAGAAALTAGLGSTGALGKIVGGLGRAGQTTFAQGALGAVSGNLVNQAARRLAGADTSFSWRAIAISAVSGGVANAVASPVVDRLGFDLASTTGQQARDLAAGMSGGIVSTHLNRRYGSGEDVDMASVIADAFGSMLANRITGQHRMAADVVAARTASLAANTVGGGTDLADGTFAPSAEQLADWNRLTALEGRRRSEQSLPEVVLAGSHSADGSASTTTVYRRRMVDSHEIARYGGDPNYLNIVNTYAVAEAQRSHFELLPGYAPAPTLISDTAIRGRSLDEAHRSDVRYYDTFRGSIWGDAFAQAGTMANGAGYNLLRLGNSMLGLATDRRYGEEVKSTASYVISNPGVVVDAGIAGAKDWWASPLDQKLTNAGTAAFEFIPSAGFSLFRRMDGLAGVVSEGAEAGRKIDIPDVELELPGATNSKSAMPELAGLRGELRVIDTSEFSNAQKGALGEARASIVLRRAGYKEIPARLSSNNGFDGVFVKYGPDGNPVKIVVTESKFSSTGSFSLTNTKTMGRQLSPLWIDANIEKMRFSDDPAVVATARLLRSNSELITIKANALNPQGVNRWNLIKLPE